MTLDITNRYAKTLSSQGARPTQAPDWIDDIDNPYLHGLYAPVTTEVDGEDLHIEGELPKDLNGAYFRNGPNSAHAPLNRYHWFEAMKLRVWKKRRKCGWEKEGRWRAGRCLR